MMLQLGQELKMELKQAELQIANQMLTIHHLLHLNLRPKQLLQKTVLSRCLLLC